MRALDGQHSDRVAIKRTRDQKERQLAQLKEQLGSLKSHAADSLRTALTGKIAALESELAAPARRRG
jgi:hypothetical protein